MKVALAPGASEAIVQEMTSVAGSNAQAGTQLAGSNEPCTSSGLMSSLTGTPVAAALPLLPTVIWNWIVLPGLAALVPANEPDGRVRTSFSGLRLGLAVTVVVVSHSGSVEAAGHSLPGPVTTTTLGRLVVPAGKVASSTML